MMKASITFDIPWVDNDVGRKTIDCLNAHVNDKDFLLGFLSGVECRISIAEYTKTLEGMQ